MNLRVYLWGMVFVPLFIIPIAWFWISNYQPVSFEKLVIKAEAEHNPKCNVRLTVLKSQPDDLVAMCATFGTQTWLYAKEHPKEVIKLYTLLGKTDEWHEIVDKYGRNAILVVWKYYTDGSKLFQLNEHVRTGLRQIWEGQPVTFKGRTLTPLEFALGAVASIHEHGHRFLDRFEVIVTRDTAGQVSGHKVKPKPVAQFMSILVTNLTGGINRLEKKYARGKKITPSDVGWAALDTAVIAAIGVSAVVALKKATVATAAKGVVAKGAAKGAVVKTAAAKGIGWKAVVGATGALTIVGQHFVPQAAHLGLLYLVFTDPWDTAVLLAGGVRWTIEWALDWPLPLAFVIAWAVVGFIYWSLFSPLVKLFWWSWRGLRYLHRKYAPNLPV